MEPEGRPAGLATAGLAKDLAVGIDIIGLDIAVGAGAAAAGVVGPRPTAFARDPKIEFDCAGAGAGGAGAIAAFLEFVDAAAEFLEFLEFVDAAEEFVEEENILHELNILYRNPG